MRTIEKIGPLTIRGNTADCDLCQVHLLAASNAAAMTMSKRHWLLAHPEWESC